MTDHPIPKNEGVRELSDAEKAVLVTLRGNFLEVEGKGETFNRARALSFRGQHKFVRAVGRSNLESHATETLKWTTKARTLTFALAASVIIDVNVYGATNEKDRADRHARVAPVAKMLEALAYYSSDHEALNDEAFIKWYDEKGKFEGIWREYKKANPTTAKASDTDGEGKVEDIIATMLANPAAFEVKNGLNLPAGTVSIFVAQGEGTSARLVPMNVTPAFVASLAGNAPDPLDSAPTDLRFWRELLMTGETIIPDTLSDLPAVEIAPDDVVNATTPMLASYAMFMVRDGKISVASARDHDTLVLEVTPMRDVRDDLNVSFARDGFINNRSRRVTSKRLIASTTCAGFIPERKTGKSDEEQSATKVTSADGKATIAFKHRDRRFNSNLVIAPRSSLGSNWTYRVAGFSDAVNCEMTAEPLCEFADTLALIAKAKKDHPIAVSIDDAGVSFAVGKAAARHHAGQAQGKASVKVDRGDLVRAVSGLMATDQVVTLNWYIDARGLLAVETTTMTATHRVYIQTLREDGVRHRTLLSLVQAEDAAVAKAA